ncbi:MAG: hypothetical protein LBG04_00050, partial [Holosporaceae bacterium]|nr:hypothetical protein [Holosporaceae bacterium]
KQAQYSTLGVEEQVVSIYLGVNGYLDNLELKAIHAFEKYVLERMKHEEQEILSSIRTLGEITTETNEKLKAVVSKYLNGFEKKRKSVVK